MQYTIYVYWIFKRRPTYPLSPDINRNVEPELIGGFLSLKYEVV